MSRKRVPLNQNECTDDFRIDVPFEQNLHFSIGVLWRENENDIVTMLKEADNIMYTEKKKYHLENKEL